MDEIITFDKNFEHRLEEYITVFGNSTTYASQIKKQWSVYLEFILEPNGWQALWKIPRTTCERLNIEFPTVVIVTVEDIHFENLTAKVQVIAIQGNIDIPLIHTTSLTKIWPTKKQESSVDIVSIANALDMLRFFYYHLWMPWDLKECGKTDWVKNNLSDRLNIFYSRKKEYVSKYKIRKYRTLLADIKTTLEYLDDDGTFNVNIDIPEDSKDPKADLLVNLHIKISNLKSESEILELYLSENDIEVNLNNNCWVVFNSGSTLNDYKEFMNSIHCLIPSDNNFQSEVSLQEALDSANFGDTIIIGSGKHQICSAGVLDDGAILKSPLIDNSEVIIEYTNENLFLNFTGNSLTLENVTVNLLKAQCGIIAHIGEVTLKNCQLIGQGMSFCQFGIGLLPGANIILENCRISDFNVGIYASSTSAITLKNCTILNTNIPVKFRENAIININKCKFINYKECGINLIENASEDSNEVGDLSLLNFKSNVIIENCTFNSIDGINKNVIITKDSGII